MCFNKCGDQNLTPIFLDFFLVLFLIFETSLRINWLTQFYFCRNSFVLRVRYVYDIQTRKLDRISYCIGRIFSDVRSSDVAVSDDYSGTSWCTYQYDWSTVPIDQMFSRTVYIQTSLSLLNPFSRFI